MKSDSFCIPEESRLFHPCMNHVTHLHICEEYVFVCVRGVAGVVKRCVVNCVSHGPEPSWKTRTEQLVECAHGHEAAGQTHIHTHTNQKQERKNTRIRKHWRNPARSVHPSLTSRSRTLGRSAPPTGRSSYKTRGIEWRRLPHRNAPRIREKFREWITILTLFCKRASSVTNKIIRII